MYGTYIYEYILPPQDTPQIERDTQTKSKRVEEIFHANGKKTKRWYSNTYI